MLTKIQEEILIGLMLGDGSLWKGEHGKTPQLCITRAIKDKNYIYYHKMFFSDFISNNGIRETSYYDERTNKIYHRIMLRTGHNDIFNKYYQEWYKDGYKIVPNNLELTPTIIA